MCIRDRGYTEHSYAHVTRVAHFAEKIMADLGYPRRMQEPVSYTHLDVYKRQVLRDEAEKEKAPPLRFDRDEAYLFVNSAVPPTLSLIHI